MNRISLRQPIWRKIQQARYHKFLLVGAVNAAVDLLVLNVCMLLQPTTSSRILLIYNTFAVVCAITTSYNLNRRWTFRDTATNSRRERSLFWLQGALNVVVNDLVLYLISRYLLVALDWPLFISGNLSKAVAMFVSSSISFTVLRLFVFKE